jgi:hypothetical protein
MARRRLSRQESVSDLVAFGNALKFIVGALSSREPVPGSLENALSYPP